MLLGLVTAVWSGCGDDGPVTSVGVPVRVEIVSGDGQSGVAGTVLPELLVVRVVARGGAPVQDVTVTWQGSGQFNPSEAFTDGHGEARVEWVLGDPAAEATAIASVDGLTPAVFSATVTPGEPGQLTRFAGHGQVGTVGEALSDSLAVRVRDERGYTVPGAQVEWAVASGDGSISPQVVEADEYGVARARWVLGPDPGEHEATATVNGLSPLSFRATAEPAPAYSVIRKTDPDRTEVWHDKDGWVATFTDGAYTVAYRGPALRTFAEEGAMVRHDTWVRLLENPFNGRADTTWLKEMRQDTTPDLLAIAMQYINGAPPVYQDGLKIAGDAAYVFGADFFDYLGIDWTYPDGSVRNANPEQLNGLDCSGYVRMVFGYRGTPHRLVMSINTLGNTTLPRTSFNQYLNGTGVVLIPNEEVTVPPGQLGVLQPGDVLFWDTSDSRDTPGGINHVGIFLGRDTGGNHRFIHSAGSTNGPAFGRPGSTNDFILDSGFYMTTFRAVRRF